MKPLHATAFLVFALLSACTGSDVSQYVLQNPEVSATTRSQTSVEILEVSLPQYAKDQEIPFADASGVIHTDRDALWADAPPRAISLALAEALSKLTGSIAASEPWPLDERADATLDIRVRKLLASAEGSLQFSGQYFIVFETGRNPRSQWFDISVPLNGRGAADVAEATGKAVTELAKMVSGQLR